jgi:NTP pyrophosphatase (non-canonical NTP hydrolase)
MQSLRVIQDEIGAWALCNFGEQQPYRPFLGVGEELGELREAQMLRNHEKAKDAIGDIAIYLMHYCVLRQWSFEEVWEGRAAAETFASDYLVVLGSLCHHQLKSEQGIRGGQESHAYASKYVMGQLLSMLEEESPLHGGEFLAILQKTWDQVKQRDWRKNPDNADKVVEEGSPGTLRPEDQQDA